MKVLEAKDFLVHQTAEQAALENVPLSDLEKRMMYFTETDEYPEDPIALNDAFEAEYDTDEYEAKTHALLHRAYERLQMVRPEAILTWDEAISLRAKGDHYVSILWGDYHAKERPQEPPPYDPLDSLKLLGTALLVAAAMLMFGFVWLRIAPHFQHFIPGSMARYLIYLSALGLYFVGRHYWRRTRSRKHSGQA
jgi:hypothetical protein